MCNVLLATITVLIILQAQNPISLLISKNVQINFTILFERRGFNKFETNIST